MEKKGSKEDPLVLLRKALLHLNNNNPKEAIALLELSDFKDENLLKNQIYAAALSDLKEYNRAECTYLTLIRNYPDSLDSKFALSELYLKTGRLTQAEELIDFIIQVNPNYYMAWNNKGNLAKLRKDYPIALSCYEKSLSICPDFMTAQKNIFLLYKVMGNEEDAMKIARESIEKESKCLWGYLYLIEHYKNNNEQKKVLHLVNLAIKHCGEVEQLMAVKES